MGRRTHFAAQQRGSPNTAARTCAWRGRGARDAKSRCDPRRLALIAEQAVPPSHVEPCAPLVAASVCVCSVRFSTSSFSCHVACAPPRCLARGRLQMSRHGRAVREVQQVIQRQEQAYARFVQHNQTTDVGNVRQEGRSDAPSGKFSANGRIDIRRCGPSLLWRSAQICVESGGDVGGCIAGCVA